jgi:hypothetical protein
MAKHPTGRPPGRPPRNGGPAPVTVGALALAAPAVLIGRRVSVFLDEDVANLLSEYPDASATIRAWVSLSQRKPMRPAPARAV